MSPRDLRYFLGCVLIWGTTWLAITFQLGAMPPELSVALRFGLAALVLAGYCHHRGDALRLSWPVQRAAAAMGFAMFTAGYLFVYYAEMHVVSGLVAVGYCASPLVNQFFYRIFLGRPASRRVTVGGVLGLLGIALVYAPELAGLRLDGPVLLGALLTAGAVIASALGNIASSRLEARGINVWQKMMLSMAWGAAGSVLVGLFRGVSWAIAPDLAFVLSLLYLALFGTIAAFAMYLTLLETIGGGKAGYIGVMVPIVALGLSTLFEGYVWTALGVTGITLAIVGNLIIMLPTPVQH